MEDILESILGYRTISPSKARRIHHLSHTPPEYWTAEERMLSGKLRTEWLREERKRAARGGNPAILERIWPVGPYWPNGGVLAGGERARRDFREEVGRMRYRDQARAEAHAEYYNVHPSDLLNLPTNRLNRLKGQGDWTRGEANQILNDRRQARLESSHHPGSGQAWRRVGRNGDLAFSRQELLRNGRFGNMVYAPSERDLYRQNGWDLPGGGGGEDGPPVYVPMVEEEEEENPGAGGRPGGRRLDRNGRPRLFDVGNGPGPDWYRDALREGQGLAGGGASWGGRPPFYPT